MDQNDRQAIQALFGKLASVEQQVPNRDAEAEAFIRNTVARQPAAPYYMAQTVIVQEHALNAAQARIEALEAEVARKDQPEQGGFMSRVFGGGTTPTGGSSIPRVGRGQETPQSPFQRPHGGGFLAGAAQTAMGVAGGVLLGNAIAGMLGGEAMAEELPPEEGYDEPEAFDDGGFDEGE
ncbi:DUF2076 domain-containing protein [Falsirhodobacter xinxiangensis]|uniref:DUF2076 domain-containing protein n=1 Tax=Falsirhodobacter xinxiangensis TaxID=2530049 RepID=UPI0010A99FC3|nr:DUF2076 domain-containing protein [Rhodobacter xinxiangensis]